MKLERRGIEAEILADSINTATGDRLTTFRVRFPKWLLAEFNTHRALSRNWSSSRAVPAKKLRRMVLEDPCVPIKWGANQKGMQADIELIGWRRAIAERLWLLFRYPACCVHWLLGDVIGLHKQLVNRILELWMWADGVVSATEWKNFFALRDHEDAQPEFGCLAAKMHALHNDSTPKHLEPGQWHLPFMWDTHKDLMTIDFALRVSAARCARVSYYLRDGNPSLPSDDVALCDRLAGADPKHLSPMEHQAMALPTSDRVGNFVGFNQFRKQFVNEANGDYQIKLTHSHD